LHGKLAWKVDEAGGVEVDIEVCNGEDVLLNAGVLADSKPDAPAVELERGRPVAGREADRLLATEVALAVEGDCRAVDSDTARWRGRRSR
jgi:hypothetical protein